MAMFVHLTPESRAKRISRNGISPMRKLWTGERGVFALPVTRNFYISHQWLRELKRGGGRSIFGVYFRIPDDERVWIGHYNQAHQTMTAAEAVALMMSAEAGEGFQVIVPRRIEAKDIHRVRRLPQVVGWRYYPGSHGKKPCGCPFCQRGLYGGRKLRDECEKEL